MPELQDTVLTSALLEAQNSHKSVKIYTQNTAQRFFSTILGYDYFESSLLIEGLQPSPHMSTITLLETQPFWIQLKEGDRFLNVLCILRERHYDLYTLKIVKYEFSDNQRWFPRIHFDTLKGPEFIFEAQFNIPIVTNIRDLSVHGAAVESPGKDLRESFLGISSCPCKIRFNELFTVSLEAEIKQINFIRKPSCHTHIRLMFESICLTSQVQLENFIDAFNKCDERTNLAQKTLINEAHFA